MPFGPGLAGQANTAAQGQLLIRYRRTTICTVYPNLSKSGVVGNAGHTWPHPRR
jgi:hypothetical protein